MKRAWPVYTNPNLFFDKKKKLRIGKFTDKLTFLCYDILVKKRSLHRNVMAAIPKITYFVPLENISKFRLPPSGNILKRLNNN